MNIGVPRETKDGERRVGLTPDGVRELVADGHRVVVGAGAGDGVGFADDAYRKAGAVVSAAMADIWSCTLIVKVKEIQHGELPGLCAGTTIFGFAQLNRDPALLRAVLDANVTILAYETVTGVEGTLPLLAPMSRIAGRLAPLVGAMALTTGMGGSGVLLTGVDTVPGADVVVVGAGNAGGEAALTAARMGARVRVFSRGEPRLQTLARKATEQNLQLELHALSPHGDGRFEDAVVAADLVIGGVLEPGKLSPKLIPRALVAAMHKGAAIVDIGIDHGGIAATSAMTKISAPTYVAEGVVHYAVANMPTLVARTATLALTAATGPFVRGLAALGIERALGAFPGLAAGLMVTGGEVVHPGLAADAGLTHPRAASIPN